MKAFVLIKIRTGEVELVLRDLYRIPAVADAYMTFGPHDAIAMIEAEDLKQIGQIVYSEIQPIPGILQTLTLLAIESQQIAKIKESKLNQHLHPN
jgi:DNA-binding Lrp family transcriptional regulator